MIHNGQLSRERSPTQRSLRDIAMRVLQASGRAGVVGDLFRIYAIARREQATFQWVTIAEDVDLARAEIFDPVKMSELYAIGYSAALTGPVWTVGPPWLPAEPVDP